MTILSRCVICDRLPTKKNPVKLIPNSAKFVEEWNFEDHPVFEIKYGSEECSDPICNKCVVEIFGTHSQDNLTVAQALLSDEEWVEEGLDPPFEEKPLRGPQDGQEP